MRTAALLVLALSTLPAAARETVPLRDDAAAPERPIVEQVYRSWVDWNRGAVLETAMLDLDRDGTAEIAVRFRHATTCDGAGGTCRVALLRHDGTRWAQVLETIAGDLSLDDGADALRPVVVDGREVHRWTGRDYRIDARASGGETVGFAKADDKEAATLLATFGERAERLAGVQGVQVSYARFDLGAGDGAEVIARLDGAAACGLLSGCPVRVLTKVGDRHRVVLETTTTGEVTALPASGRMARSLAVDGSAGPVVYSWHDGEGYRREGSR